MTFKLIKYSIIFTPDDIELFPCLKTVIFNLRNFKLAKVYNQINEDFNKPFSDKDLNVRKYIYENYRDLISQFDEKIIPYFYGLNGYNKECWSIDGNSISSQCVSYLNDKMQFNSFVKFMENRVLIPQIKFYLNFK